MYKESQHDSLFLQCLIFSSATPSEPPTQEFSIHLLPPSVTLDSETMKLVCTNALSIRQFTLDCETGKLLYFSHSLDGCFLLPKLTSEYMRGIIWILDYCSVKPFCEVWMFALKRRWKISYPTDTKINFHITGNFHRKKYQKKIGLNLIKWTTYWISQNLTSQPTTSDHINIKYILGPHVNHMGTPG